jgi:hypothetical protein
MNQTHRGQWNPSDFASRDVQCKRFWSRLSKPKIFCIWNNQMQNICFQGVCADSCACANSCVPTHVCVDSNPKIPDCRASWPTATAFILWATNANLLHSRSYIPTLTPGCHDLWLPLILDCPWVSTAPESRLPLSLDCPWVSTAPESRLPPLNSLDYWLPLNLANPLIRVIDRIISLRVAAD